MKDDITIKLPADDAFSHPTMGEPHTPSIASVDFPKNIHFGDEFIDLTGVDHILTFKDCGFIKYKDGREIRFNKERVWKLYFLLAYLHAMDYPQPSKRARTFRFNPFWLVWFLATLAMAYFISMR